MSAPGEPLSSTRGTRTAGSGCCHYQQHDAQHVKPACREIAISCTVVQIPVDGVTAPTYRGSHIC